MGAPPTRDAHGREVEKGRVFLAVRKAGVRNSGRLTEDMRSIFED